jgi:hypothetical protein
MATMLPKVLEIERRQLADYARVDYAITKGEDEIAALEELRLGPDELRRETSVVRDRTVLAVREVRKNMAKRAITAKNMRGSLVESLRQRSRFAVADTVDASLRARCFASLECRRWEGQRMGAVGEPRKRPHCLMCFGYGGD